MRRREVAMLCFEAPSPAVAVARLGRWIRTDPQLLYELEACGYRPRLRYFTPKQVRVLRRYLL